jgi:hypothetical protein
MCEDDEDLDISKYACSFLLLLLSLLIIGRGHFTAMPRTAKQNFR